MEEINVILTTPEAILFRDFQQFHEKFQLLLSRGVLNMKNGSVEIHFDKDGIIQKIDRHDSLFNHRLESNPQT